MSINSIIVRNLVSEFRDTVQWKIREHGHEIIIGAIMTIISVGIVAAATGDMTEVFAGARGR
jgi:hypothetical protein